MEINPNVTPPGISLEEIKEIAQGNSEQVRLFRIDWVVGWPVNRIRIVALPTVYFSEDFGDSLYFAQTVHHFVYGRFLEIGCGTGAVIIATALAKRGHLQSSLKKYVAIDINPLAVLSGKINALLNGVGDLIDFRQGDVFEPLEEDERFDCIFWAHPFHIGSENEDIASRACFDPLFQGLEKYVKDGHRFLNKGGKLLLGSGNFAELDDIRKIMYRHGCEMNLLHYVHRPFKGRCGELNTYNIYEIS